jgi:hypothetical protein
MPYGISVNNGPNSKKTFGYILSKQEEGIE